MRALTIGLVLLAGAARAAPDGKALYTANCAQCHQPDGAGGAGLAPPLKDHLAVYAATPQGRNYLARVPLGGMAGTITVDGAAFVGIMPAFAQLSDAELSAVLTYALHDLNALPAGAVSAAEVTAARAAHPSPSTSRKIRQALLAGK